MSRKEGKNIKKILVGSLIAVFIMSLMAGLIPYDLGVHPVSAASTKKAPIHINNTAGGALSYYQVNLNITYDSDMNNDFSDIRVKNETAGAFVPYWIEDKLNDSWCNLWFNATSIPASSWCNDTYYLHYGDVGASSASNGTNTFEFFDDFEDTPTPADYYKFSVSVANHNDYGLSYPITYKFTIPSGSSNLKAYKKFTIGDSWVQITEKTTSDFFNGIGAVRFDYTNNFAYVSVAFDASYEDIYIKVVNASDSPVGIYSKITDYYDSRKCTVTTTLDEWDDGNEIVSCERVKSIFGDGARVSCDECTSRHLWVTMGIVTKGHNGSGAPNWTEMQTKIDAGYIEPASHTRTHFDAEVGGGEESEIDGSKNDILNNLTMPALNKKGATEYLYAFIEPFGKSSAAERSQLGTSKYLSDRQIGSGQTEFASWDSANSLYYRIGYKIRMGIDGETNVATLNSSFDSCYNNGQIYHLMWHSAQETTPGCYGVDYTAGSYFHQHLDYIKDKKDVWYVGFGHLYLYHYVKERNIVTVTSSGGSSGDTSKWTDIPDNGIKSIVTSPVQKGSGSMKLEDTSSSNYDVWRNLTPRTKYAFHWYARPAQTNAGQVMDVYQDDTKGIFLVFDSTANIKYYDGAYHTILDPYVADTWYQFEVHADANTDKFDLWLDGVKKVTDGNFQNALTTINKFMFQGYSSDTPIIYIDDFFVRKYASPEPTALLGGEQTAEGGDCTTPVISDLTNSTPGTTNITITWSTNQSADSRVKYSKNSDLSSHSWSSWDNDTISINIDLSSLDTGTPYYYQAWSYNGTNSSCYVTEPTGQPYETFTTQSDTGGAYNITLLTGWNIIGWTDTTTRTASYVANDIGSNCTYVTERNKTSGNYETFDPNFPDYYNFDVERGWGYFTMVSGETLWERDA